VYACHVIACLWYFVGEVGVAHSDCLPPEGTDPDDWGMPESCGWRSVEWGTTSAPPPIDGYIKSYYWAITTLSTVGYGDISPVTQREEVVTILVMLTGNLIFAMLIGTLGSMMVGQKLLGPGLPGAGG